MQRDKAEIMKLKTDLASAQPVYHYAGRSYTPQAVKLDLANRFERYKTHDATLASLREIESARRKGLEAARQKLDGMLAQRRQLEVDVEHLEAKFKVVQVSQVSSNVNIDDSQLGRLKDLLAEIRTRLNVAERLANTTCDLDGEIPLSGPQSDNIVDQVTEYFATEHGAAAAVAEAEVH